MDTVSRVFQAAPELALFVSLALGYLIGRIRVGPIALGGIAGTLIVAIVIGQLGVTISDDAKNIAFATFIFALGFTAGPEFFAHLDREGLKLGTFTAIEAVTVTFLVLIWTELLELDPGTAAGLLAGSATQSAVVGTASDAITGLPVDASTATMWQANVATAYSLSYVFGLVTIVLFTSEFAPILARTDLRAAAETIHERMSGGEVKFRPGEAPAAPGVVGRIHEVTAAAEASVATIETALGSRARIERVRRGSETLDAQPDLILEPADLVLLVGLRESVLGANRVIGPERPDDAGLGAATAIESREIWVSGSGISGRTIGDIRHDADADAIRGVYLTGLARGEEGLPPLDEIPVRTGDVVTLTGSSDDLDRVTPRIGRKVPRTAVTDFIYLGVGTSIGILIGRITFELGGVPVSIGTGVGCLLTGLVFGSLHARRPLIGNYPPAAAAFARDFGLATFIAAVGLSVGPQAAALLGQYGLALPIAGILNVLIPATLSLVVGLAVLKLELPILAGAIGGQQCSTPAGTAVVDRAGNAVPMLGYTVTYALSSVVLPLLGPVIVLLTYALQ